MSCAYRTLLGVGILASRLLMGQSAPAPAPLPPAEDASQLPPEEDSALNPAKQYGFNPVQSKREVAVGMIYLKKGSYKAAASRFQEATRWNDTNAEAWLRLGEAEEKRGNVATARTAYQHYLEVAPDAKNAAEITKKLQRLK